MTEFDWNSIFWYLGISWRINQFFSSNGKQGCVHIGHKFLIFVHKGNSWWIFESIYRLPYIFWNSWQNVKIILSTASRHSFDMLCCRNFWVLWDNIDKCSLGNISTEHPLHEKQHFCKNAQRKHHIFVIFRIWRKYHIFRKTKIKENMIFSLISDIFCNKSIKQDNDRKEKKRLED